MNRFEHCSAELILLCFAAGSTAIAGESSEAASAELAPVAQAPTPPVAPDPMPAIKRSPRPIYPPDLLRNHIEGRVLAHFKIDDRGRAIDGVLDYDTSKKSFAAAVANWLNAVRFKVPKGWSGSASPTYEIWFVYVICSDDKSPEQVRGAFSIVVTGCTTD